MMYLTVTIPLDIMVQKRKLAQDFDQAEKDRSVTCYVGYDTISRKLDLKFN